MVSGIGDSNFLKNDSFRVERAAEWILWHAMISHHFDFARGSIIVEDCLLPSDIGSGFAFEISSCNLRDEIRFRLEQMRK